MVRFSLRSWRQQDQFDWFSAYLDDQGLQTLWRRAIFGFTAGAAAMPIVMLWSPAGPDNTLTTTVAVIAAGIGAAGAFLWLLRWPTRQQSVLFSLTSTVAIAATCLSLSNVYPGLAGCTAFAVLGGFVAYFHTRGEVLFNVIVAAGCSVFLAGRLIATTGDVALASAALLTVAALNVGVPFGIQSLVHTLRTDLRGSDRDSLTGLHNRRSFNYTVYELMMNQPQSEGTYLVIIMVDLDNFKQVNDTHGHAAGDEALVSVGVALRESCRATAVIGRAGGEEFVIADIHTRPDLVKTAERLRQAISATPAKVTASIGTARVHLKSGPISAPMQLIDDLIRAADVAMYEAKRAGGNQVAHYKDFAPPRED